MPNSYVHNKIKTMVDRANDYQFPEFLSGLRNNLGWKRRIIALDIGVSPHLLTHLERGDFVQMPQIKVLAALEGYYNLPVGLLVSKCREYCDEVKTNPRHKSAYDRYPELQIEDESHD